MGRRGVLTVRLGTGVSRMLRHRCEAVAQKEATGASNASPVAGREEDERRALGTCCA